MSKKDYELIERVILSQMVRVRTEGDEVHILDDPKNVKLARVAVYLAWEFKQRDNKFKFYTFIQECGLMDNADGIITSNLWQIYGYPLVMNLEKNKQV